MKKITTLALSLLSAGLIGCGTPQDVPVGTLTAKLTSAQLEASYKEAFCYAKFAGAGNRATCLANFSSSFKISDAGVGLSDWAWQFTARLSVNGGVNEEQVNHDDVYVAADNSQNTSITDFDTNPEKILWDSFTLSYVIAGDSFE